MPRILIVDDDESIVEALSAILTDFGYLVHSLTKGEETLRAVLSFAPDLICMDILMSGSDGTDICKTLKANPKTKSIPVIMISAHPMAAKLSKAAGADGYLLKPFGIQELVGAIKKYTQKFKRA